MQIVDNIPVPESPKGSYVRYPFAEMKPGDSFLAPFTNGVREAATQWKKRHPGWDYTTRTQGDSIRLWCTAVPQQQTEEPK